MALPKKQLTPKQLQFVKHYLVCPNASEAARRAGYEVEQCYLIGTKLLKDHRVKGLIQEYREDYKETVLVTYDWKSNKLKQIVEMAMTRGEVDAMGRPLVSIDHALKAIAEMNKMAGHYAPEQVMNTNVNVTGNLTDIKELTEKLLAKRGRQIEHSETED